MIEVRDKLAIACNIAEPTKECVRGALAFVINDNPGNGGESMQVLARSRSGRWIRKWERLYRLCNFRVKTIPPTHPRYEDDIFVFNSIEKSQVVGYAQRFTRHADEWRAHRAANHQRRWDNCDECKQLISA
jgi:hypothetical protein